MNSFSDKIKLIYILPLLFLLITNNAFSDSKIVPENPDSILVFRLCDTARANISDFNIAVDYSEKANILAYKTNNEACIAESEFTYGVVYFNYSNYDSSIFHLDIALNKFKNNNNRKRIIDALYYLSYLYFDICDFHESIKFSKLGIKYADSLSLNREKANFYLTMGSCYQEVGSYKKSTDALITSLKLFEAENDSSGISASLINLGLIFSNNNSYDDALEYTNRALEICKKLNDKNGISVCYNNIGNFYSSKNDYEKALKFFLRSYEIDVELDNIEGVAITLNNIGDTYRNLKDTVLAISYYNKSLEIGEPNNYPIVAVVMLNLSEVYMGQSKFKLALSYAIKSLNAALLSGISEDILASYDLLQKVYSSMGRYEDAYKYLLKHKHLFDSIYSITKSMYIIDVKSKYNDEKQKTEISSLKKINTSVSLIKTYLIIIILIISLFIVAMLIIIIVVRKSKRLANKQKLYYEKLLDRSEDFIFIISKDGLTKYISPSYERKIGREIKSRIGKSTFEFIHPDDVEFVKKEFGMLIKDGQPRNIEFKFQDVYDNWIDVYAYGQNYFGDGVIDGILVNFWDITQRKKNEEKIRQSGLKFRQIFNAFPDIYFQTDRRGVITEVSPSIFKLSGYKREEVIGISPKEYFNFLSDWETMRVEFKNTSYVHDFDTQLIKKDGTIVDCSLSAEFIYSQYSTKPIGFKGVLRDISSRIKAQKELRQSEQKLKETNNSKEKLFSIIAHDLIGPIGTNKAIVDLIVGQVDELTHEEIVSLISSLKPSLDSTYSLIENLLSWARIQQDRLKPNLESISLNMLLNDMISLMNGQSIRKSITIKISDNKPVTIMADKNQLDIVFRNLVSNAIKFSHKGDKIYIIVDINNNLAEVKIIDSGVGMNQKQIDSILSGQGNTEVKKGTNNEKGTGFGLVIVNEFVKSNNGTLHASSKEGEGTTFTITFPLLN